MYPLIEMVCTPILLHSPVFRFGKAPHTLGETRVQTPHTLLIILVAVLSNFESGSALMAHVWHSCKQLLMHAALTWLFTFRDRALYVRKGANSLKFFIETTLYRSFPNCFLHNFYHLCLWTLLAHECCPRCLSSNYTSHGPASYTTYTEAR